MASRTVPMALVAVLVVATFAAAEAPEAPVEAELSVEAQAMVDAAEALTADLNSTSPRAEIAAAEAALKALMASVDAELSVAGVSIEGPTVKAAIQKELGKTFWLLVVADARADPLASYDLALRKVESAEDKLDVDVTARGAAHARHQLRHAMAIATALDIVGGVDADVLAELTARIKVDLERCKAAQDAAEACGCPITLEVRTALNVVVAATADVATKAVGSVSAAFGAAVGLVGGG